MAQTENFIPNVGIPPLNIGSSTSASSGTFTNDGTGCDTNKQIRIVVVGTNNVFLRFSNSLQPKGIIDATTSDMIMLGNTVEVFGFANYDSVSVITSGGTSVVNVTAGSGS